MALHEPRVQIPEDPVALTGTYKAFKRFNRNRTWVATGLLGSVVFAAVMLALQQREPKADDLTKEARQTSDLLRNASLALAPISDVVASNEKSTGEITSGQATTLDYGVTVISPQENPFPRVGTAASTQTPANALTPEKNHPDVQANASSWSRAHWRDSRRVIGLKVPRARSRSSVRLRFVDVKMRLIALWHQSLARSEKSRTWTGSSNP